MTTDGSRGSIVVQRIARLVVEHPKRVLLAGVLLFLALAPGVGRVYENIKYHIWFPEGDPKIAVLDDFEQRFGSDLSSMLIVHSPSGLFDKESAELLIELTDRMWKVSETIRVESLSNFTWVHADGDELIVEPLIPDDRELTPELLAQRREVALNHEQLPGLLVSPDGKTTVIYGYLQPTKTGEGENQYNDFQAIIADLHKIVEDYAGKGDHQLHVTGFPVTEGYLEVHPPREMQELMPVILVTCVVLLFVFFRRLSGVLLPLAIVIPSVLSTLAIAGWADFAINPMTITAPNIMVIIGISSSVHVLVAYFRALDHGRDRREAARVALENVLGSTFMACLTTGIGFLSLLAMTIPPMQQLGVLVAAGTMLVWVLSCLILGPLMVLARIKPRPLKEGAAGASADGVEEALEQPSERSRRFVGFIDRFKVPILVGWTALLGGSLWLAFNNKVSFDPIEWYDKSTDVRAALDFMRDHMGSSESFEVVIEAGEEEGIKDPEFLRKVDQLGQWLVSHDKIVRVSSLVDILKETNRALFNGDPAQYKLPDTRRGVADQYLLYTMNLPMGKNINDRVTLTNNALRMTVLSRLENSPAVVGMTERIRAKAKEMGLEVKITGRPLLYHQLNNHAVPSFFRSMITGTVVIAIILLIFFRSVRLGLLSLFLNLGPLVVGAGVVLTLLGKNFDMSTVSTFVIAFGVAVDDTVHFLSGYGGIRRRGFGIRDSIIRVWATIGPAMFITSAILAVCFGLFILITFPVLKYLGVLVSLMLVIAFVADAVVSPALLLLLQGRKKGAAAGQAG